MWKQNDLTEPRLNLHLTECNLNTLDKIHVRNRVKKNVEKNVWDIGSHEDGILAWSGLPGVCLRGVLPYWRDIEKSCFILMAFLCIVNWPSAHIWGKGGRDATTHRPISSNSSGAPSSSSPRSASSSPLYVELQDQWNGPYFFSLKKSYASPRCLDKVLVSVSE